MAGESTGNGDGEVQEQESDAQLVEVTLSVLCLGCEQLVAGSHAINLEASDFDPELLPDFDLVCPHCTQASGVRTVIPVVVGVGQHRAELVPDDEEVQAVPEPVSDPAAT